MNPVVVVRVERPPRARCVRAEGRQYAQSRDAPASLFSSVLHILALPCLSLLAVQLITYKNCRSVLLAIALAGELEVGGIGSCLASHADLDRASKLALHALVNAASLEASAPGVHLLSALSLGALDGALVVRALEGRSGSSSEQGRENDGGGEAHGVKGEGKSNEK